MRDYSGNGVLQMERKSETSGGEENWAIGVFFLVCSYVGHFILWIRVGNKSDTIKHLARSYTSEDALSFLNIFNAQWRLAKCYATWRTNGTERERQRLRRCFLARGGTRNWEYKNGNKTLPTVHRESCKTNIPWWPLNFKVKMFVRCISCLPSRSMFLLLHLFTYFV